MTLDSIIKLLDAGYTKEEINAMTESQEEPKKEEPKKEEPKKEEPKKDEPAGNDDMLKLLVDKFDELKTSIIESNIRNSQNRTPDNPDPAELLANIIKPDNKK